MYILFWLLLCNLAWISITNGLNCIVCSSTTNLDCEDPFHGDISTSSSLSQSGFTSCLKTAYWKNWNAYSATAVIREGSYTNCISSTSTGNAATLYCCSDKENCNGTIIHSVSNFIFISLLIISCFVK